MKLPALTSQDLAGSIRRCVKCAQEVVQQGWFWVLVSEQGTGRATFCPEGDIHEVDDDE